MTNNPTNPYPATTARNNLGNLDKIEQRWRLAHLLEPGLGYLLKPRWRGINKLGR
ncbi:hypothetical protein T492DRAFT_1107108 [Pavlovales sp. CCMP2436]|nr:hypothetical protein T492DRAFT_1107108 [Pavlovales sp. CCMP2436]